MEAIAITNQAQAEVSARNANVLLEELYAAQSEMVYLRNRQASGPSVDEHTAVATAIEAGQQKTNSGRREYRESIHPLLETMADQKRMLGKQK